MRDLLKEVGGFGLSPHGGGQAVVSEAHPDAGTHLRLDGCDAVAHVHVVARLVARRGARVGQKHDLSGVEMDGVGHDRTVAEHAVVEEPIHRPGAGLSEAPVLVVLVLADVDVEPDPSRHRLPARRQRVIGDGHRRVDPEIGRDAPAADRAARAAIDEAGVLGDARSRTLPAVPVGHLETENRPEAGVGDH